MIKLLPICTVRNYQYACLGSHQTVFLEIKNVTYSHTIYNIINRLYLFRSEISPMLASVLAPMSMMIQCESKYYSKLGDFLRKELSSNVFKKQGIVVIQMEKIKSITFIEYTRKAKNSNE